MLTASNVQPDVNAASFLTALHSYLTILVENPQDGEIKCEKKNKKNPDNVWKSFSENTSNG